MTASTDFEILRVFSLESGRDGIYSSLRLSDTQPIRAFDPGAERPQSNVIVIPSGRKSALNSASAHTAEVLQEHFQKVIDARETSSGSQSDHDAIGNNAIGRIPYQRGLPTFYREHTSLDKPRSEVNPSVLESHPNAPGIQPGEFRGNAIRSTPGDMEKVDWRRSGPPIDIFLTKDASFRLSKSPKPKEVFQDRKSRF